MKVKRNFGAKLYSMFTGSVLIPALIAVICFALYLNYAVNERERINIQSILNSISQNIEMQISDIERIEQAFYIYNEVFQEAENLNNPRLYENYDELTRFELEDDYCMILTKLIHTADQNIRAVVFYPVSGGDTAYYLGKDSARLREIKCTGYQNVLWYREAVTEPEMPVFLKDHVPEYMQNEDTGRVYSYIKAVRDMNAGRVIGVIKIDVNMGELQDTLNMLERNGDNGLMLLRDGEYFGASGWITDGDNAALSDEKIRIGDREYHTWWEKIPETGLTLVYLDSRSSFYRGFAAVICASVLLLMAGVLLALVNYRRQAAQLVADVLAITNVLRDVERGRLDSHVDIRPDSEFKEIADAVNQMTDRLQEYIDREYVLEIQQQKAEYRALQSQINPHFLYNTLNGFVALNRMGEKKTLERAIISLSHLFRYTCSGSETSAIREEIAFLEDYLKLEKLKYEERLDYMILADEESRERQIPRLLLQPIVENSIRHGMGDSGEAIMIRILAETKEVKGIGKVTVLAVRDNGVGFNSRADSGIGHIGVENVRARAELFCRSAIFQCTSRPGEGTKTTIIFPYEGAEEKTV